MYNVESQTRVFGVFGDPIAHSLSPTLQNWFMQRFGVNGIYLSFHIRANRLQEAMHALPVLGFGGVNLTIPHKEAALQWIDHADFKVETLQAVNTLRIVDGEIHASVTDPDGFVLSLGEQKERFHRADVVMLGAGGSARSVAFALAGLGVSRLWIVNRTLQRAEELARIARERFGLLQTLALPAQSASDALYGAQIVINTTSVGMQPYTDKTLVPDTRLFHKGQLVYDLIYNPSMTRLLHDARRQGADIQNGLDMLIYQGLLSLSIWQQKEFLLDSTDLKKVRQLLKNRLGMHE